MTYSLYDPRGQRKYITFSERSAFIRHVEARGDAVDSFGLVLVYTGCRLSEALTLTNRHIDHEEGMIIFECLKKRRKGVYRAVPVPPHVLGMLHRLHGHKGEDQRLWEWCRVTAWRNVIKLFKAAEITKGPHACPKGLRHGFGINALTAGVPITLVQRWLGHSQLTTTAVYTQVMGQEERGFAQKMWECEGAALPPQREAAPPRAMRNDTPLMAR